MRSGSAPNSIRSLTDFVFYCFLNVCKIYFSNDNFLIFLFSLLLKISFFFLWLCSFYVLYLLKGREFKSTPNKVQKLSPKWRGKKSIKQRSIEAYNIFFLNRERKKYCFFLACWLFLFFAARSRGVIVQVESRWSTSTPSTPKYR